jgi:hypothetical protein
LPGVQHLRPRLLGDALELFIQLRLLEGLRDRMEDEGMRRLAFVLGCGSDARLQIVFEADGGCGHDSANWSRPM